MNTYLASAVLALSPFSSGPLTSAPLTWLAPAGQQADELAQADAHFAAGNWAGAAVAYGALVKSSPDDARSWYRLGYALHAQNKWREALDAHVKAATFQKTAKGATYNAACAHARLGELDEAFEWLQAAQELGFANPNLLLSDPDLTNLRTDPRFNAFLPELPTGAALFAEDVDVIHEWRGEAAGDVFGWIAQSAGDADGDGVTDVCTSAPYKAIGGANAGRVYLYSGKTGELLFQADGSPGSYLGVGIQGAGDVNKDGRDDFVAGAVNWGTGGAGQAFVYSGKDGKVVATLSAGERGDSFGRKLGGAGDVNGDGHADVVIGAPTSSAAAPSAGRAYVFSGKTKKALFTLDGEQAGDQFGSCVAGHTDSNGSFVVIGAQNGGEGDRGAAYVYRLSEREAKLMFVIPSQAGDVNLGRMFLSFVGDLDADGHTDVYVSDWESNGSAQGAGRIVVHSGKTGAELFSLSGKNPGDGFGIGTAEAGDANGDGHDDLLIGAWQNADAATSGGKCYLFSGKDASLLATYTCAAPGDTFGFDATTLGDLDGDGRMDFLITSAYSSINGYQSGRMFVVAGPKPSEDAPAR